MNNNMQVEYVCSNKECNCVCIINTDKYEDQLKPKKCFKCGNKEFKKKD